MMTSRMLAAAAMGLLVVTPGAARAQYVLTPIDVPGAAATYANGNTTHEIVGEFDDEDGDTHGFVLSRGRFTRFNVPEADGYTSINGINDQGDRSGIYFANGRYYGYFWHRGAFKTLDPSGSTFSAALFLNDLGQVVGYSVENKTRHGFVWSHGVFTTIDPPDVGPGGSRAIGINNSEQIVGAYSDKGHHIHGFLLSHGVYTPLDVPGSEDGFTFAEGINDAGQVVGYYAGADGTSHGFILDDGVYTPLDVPGSFWTEVYSINASGEIVGAYEDADGVHGFLGTPAHNPPTTGTE